MLAIFDLFDEWFHRDDFEGCSFINVLLEVGDVGHPVGRASAEHLANIRALIATLALPMAWGHLKPYQKERVKTFLEPTRDPKGSGYQLIQSLIAVGSGGIFGKGFLSGTQGSLQFLPEQHTDFVFAVLAEERGFIGAMLALGLYFVIIYRCLATARAARDRLGVFLAIGVVCAFAGQALLNIGVVVGMLPTTGVPLPLMSYGGSSLASTLLGMGFVLNVWMRRLVN